jgi:hypothetical protein
MRVLGDAKFEDVLAFYHLENAASEALGSGAGYLKAAAG